MKLVLAGIVLLSCASARAEPPSWVARCATRLAETKALFVKRHPKLAAATVTIEETRAAFSYEQDSTQYTAEVSALRGEDRPWYNPGCGDGCADMIGQRRAHGRIATYYVFVGDDAVKPDFERIFKPALDDCLAY